VCQTKHKNYNKVMLLSQFLTSSHKQRHLVKTNTHKSKQNKTKQSPQKNT